MKLLSIIASMRKNRNTFTLVQNCIESVKKQIPEIQSEILYLCDKDINHCKVVCSKFCTENPYKCSIQTDDLNEIFSKMIEADALIIGVPLYVRVGPAQFHCFLERMTSIFFYHESGSAKKEPSPLNDKPCGLVAVAEYSNPHQILEYLNDFCLLLKMSPVKLKQFPYLGVASSGGDINKDQVFHPVLLTDELAKALALNIKQKSFVDTKNE